MPPTWHRIFFSDVCSQLAYSAKINGFLSEIRGYNLKSAKVSLCNDRNNFIFQVGVQRLLPRTLYIPRNILDYKVTNYLLQVQLQIFIRRPKIRV